MTDADDAGLIDSLQSMGAAFDNPVIGRVCREAIERLSTQRREIEELRRESGKLKDASHSMVRVAEDMQRQRNAAYAKGFAAGLEAGAEMAEALASETRYEARETAEALATVLRERAREEKAKI